MSSMNLWASPDGDVVARWEKGGSYRVIISDGLAPERIRSYPTAEKAVASAKKSASYRQRTRFKRNEFGVEAVGHGFVLIYYDSDGIPELAIDGLFSTREEAEAVAARL